MKKSLTMLVLIVFFVCSTAAGAFAGGKSTIPNEDNNTISLSLEERTLLVAKEAQTPALREQTAGSEDWHVSRGAVVLGIAGGTLGFVFTAFNPAGAVGGAVVGGLIGWTMDAANGN